MTHLCEEKEKERERIRQPASETPKTVEIILGRTERNMTD